MSAIKKAAAQVALALAPSNPAPATPPPLPPKPEPLPPKPLCAPVTILPDNADAIVNNVLCREILNPTQNAERAPDPNIVVLHEIARGISHGLDISHVRDDAMRIASHQSEKISIVQSLLLGVDINRLNQFVQVRDRAEYALTKAAMRGDLTSLEYLSFLKYSASGIKEIAENIAAASEHYGGGGDSETMLDKMDPAKQNQETAAASRYKGTTPQGREIIRKQIYEMKTRLLKAGKIKGKSPAKNGVNVSK